MGFRPLFFLSLCFTMLNGSPREDPMGPHGGPNGTPMGSHEVPIGPYGSPWGPVPYFFPLSYHAEWHVPG